MIPGGRRMARIVNSKLGSNETITLTKHAAGTRNEFGEWVPGAESTQTLRANIQPITQSNMDAMRQNLPEGAQISDYKVLDILTDDIDLVRPVRVGAPQTDADSFNFYGLDWDVVEAQPWQENGHVVVTVVRRDAQNG